MNNADKNRSKATRCTSESEGYPALRTEQMGSLAETASLVGGCVDVWCGRTDIPLISKLPWAYVTVFCVFFI
jgi:hypothetical protein